MAHLPSAPGGVGETGRLSLTSLIGVCGLEQREGRRQEDGYVEPDRPILDVIEVAFDAALDFVRRIGLAAPAIDLRPAGNAGTHAMPGEIAVDDLVIFALGRLGVKRVRTGADERKIALEHDVEELRQLVEGCLANEAPDPRDARIALAHQFRRAEIERVDIHGSEFVDLDHLIVEAIALLFEEDRTLRIQPDGKGDERHHGRKQQKAERTDNPVEAMFDDEVPVRDRLLENIDERNRAGVGIGMGPELQLAHMRRKANIDGQDPQLAQHLQEPLLGRDRQREDDEIYACSAREFEKIVDRAELRKAGDDVRRTFVGAVVENAEDLQVGRRLRKKLLEQSIGRRPAADERGAPNEPASLDEPIDNERQPRAFAEEQEERAAEPGSQEFARINRLQPEEKQNGKGYSEDRGNDRSKAQRLPLSDEAELVETRALKGEHEPGSDEHCGYREGRACDGRFHEPKTKPGGRDQHEFHDARESFENDTRNGRRRGARLQGACGGEKPLRLVLSLWGLGRRDVAQYVRHF